MSNFVSRELIKQNTMTILQEQVVAVGSCPRCHIKSLKVVVENEHFRSYQCKKCQHVYMINL
jgi:uncharacterized protein YbaR (Trm112 family)